MHQLALALGTAYRSLPRGVAGVINLRKRVGMAQLRDPMRFLLLDFGLAHASPATVPAALLLDR
jgi:hypothetical protein